MAFAHVQSVALAFQNHAPSAVSAFAGATTVGNLLIVTVGGATNRSVSSVSGLGTWTQLEPVSNGTIWADVWACICTSSGTDVTVTLSAGDGSTATSLMEFSGAADPLDESGTSVEVNQSSVTTFTTGSITPDGTDTVFICCGRISSGVGGWTPDSDFTSVQTPSTGTNFNAFSMYKIQSGAASETNTTSWTTARNVVVAFAAVNGVAASLDPIRLVWRQ